MTASTAPPVVAGQPAGPAPHAAGVAVRDGVRLAWAQYGTRGPDVVLMPTWSIVHSRIWKAQVPFLARHYRVTTFDGRGSGHSGRPRGAPAYTDEQYAGDALAVLDAAGIEQAVLVALSRGAAWSVRVAALAPERVRGLFAISPACGFPIAHPGREQLPWAQRLETTDGWAKSNRHYWLAGQQQYDDFLRFFFAQMFPEPHSTKQVEDAVGWGHEIAAETLVDTTAGKDPGLSLPTEPVCGQVRCPVTVMHGTADEVVPFAAGQRLAELTGGQLLRVEDGGHGLPARDPVLVNREIRRFVDRVTGAGPPAVRWTRALRRRRRILYLSSPIGLGHARRDVAIADELRALHPDVEIDWLAQDPVSRLLAARDERVHPASAHLVSECAHIEGESAEHDLHAFQAVRRMDEILVANFMLFSELTESEPYDLVVGDEAWEVDYFLHENPELKRSAYAWFTDFVGWLPMPDGGDAEARLTADYNAEMIEHRARFRGLRDRSVFVGEPVDVVPHRFGPGLPRIRDWTAENFDFAGYVTGSVPVSQEARGELRERLGYRSDERVCVVTVGGSGVGLALLRRIADAVPQLRRQVGGLRVVLVTGPRIDPGAVPDRPGLEVRGFVPDLDQHLAACDVAVVQGGLTTCMELTANRRPFVYVPLRHHFEQNVHVRHRLDRYGAGRCLEYEQAADPDRLAAAVVAELERTVDYQPVEPAGAARAARLLADLL